MHSFKGWEARAVVVGIGIRSDSRRLAYVALSRLKAPAAAGASFLCVLCADRELDAIGRAFEAATTAEPASN